MIGGGGQPKQQISNIQCWISFWLGLFAHTQKNIEFSIESFTKQLAKYSRSMLKVFNLFGTMVLKSLINKLHPFRHEIYHCFTFFRLICRATKMRPFLVWHLRRTCLPHLFSPKSTALHKRGEDDGEWRQWDRWDSSGRKKLGIDRSKMICK